MVLEIEAFGASSLRKMLNTKQFRNGALLLKDSPDIYPSRLTFPTDRLCHPRRLYSSMGDLTTRDPRRHPSRCSYRKTQTRKPHAAVPCGPTLQFGLPSLSTRSHPLAHCGSPQLVALGEGPRNLPSSVVRSVDRTGTGRLSRIVGWMGDPKSNK